MKKPFIGVYNPANAVTYLGIAAAVVGIAFADQPRIAMLMLLLSGICDLFDGRVARMFKRTETEKRFGIQLDSFADTVAFVIFPAVFLLAQWRAVWSVLLAIFYVFAGVTRLCWFDITTDGNTKYFQGVPVTYMGLFLPALYAVAALLRIPNAADAQGVLMLVMAVLYILNIRVKKPGGVWYAVFTLLALATGAVLLLVS